MSSNQDRMLEIARSQPLASDQRPLDGASETADKNTSSLQTFNTPMTASSIDYSSFEDQPDLALSPLQGSETETASYSAEKGRHSREFATRYEGRPRLEIFSNWWLEIAACATFVAALIALCITLYAYRHKPSPNWPSWLSLNTVVAIYTVLLKTAILLVAAEVLGQLKWSWLARERRLTDVVKYDDATRGPVGALVLLWRLGTHNILAFCAALVTVLALVVDPLAQQMIRYYDCPVAAHNESIALPRTNWFEDKAEHLEAGANTISPGIQKALRNGIFGSGAIGAIGCSTGNCKSSGQYSTVGWCSECKDISDVVKIRCGAYNTTCDQDTHLPSKLYTSISNGGMSIAVEGPVGPPVPYAAMAPSPGPDYTLPLKFDFLKLKQWSSPINFDTMKPYTECQTELGKKLWKCKGYGAARCRLFPCVKTYIASVHAGMLSETLTETTTSWGALTYGFLASMVDTGCINKHERQSLENDGYQIEQDQRWLAYNVTQDIRYRTKMNGSPVESSMMEHGCIYVFDWIFFNSLAAYLGIADGTTFNGTVMGGALNSDGSPIGEFWGSQTVQAFFDSDKVEFDYVQRKFANVSNSLTTYMRQNSLANFSKSASGIVYRTTTCIDVQWQWLAYPTALVLLTLGLFLLATDIIQPTKMWPPVWKSSPLALLYHGFRRSAEESKINMYDPPDLGSFQAMKEAASRTFVRLQNDEDAVAYLEVTRKGTESPITTQKSIHVRF